MLLEVSLGSTAAGLNTCYFRNAYLFLWPFANVLLNYILESIGALLLILTWCTATLFSSSFPSLLWLVAPVLCNLVSKVTSVPLQLRCWQLQHSPSLFFSCIQVIFFPSNLCLWVNYDPPCLPLLIFHFFPCIFFLLFQLVPCSLHLTNISFACAKCPFSS